MDNLGEKMILWMLKRWADTLEDELALADMRLEGERHTWTEKKLKDERVAFTMDYIGAHLAKDQAKIDEFFVEEEVQGRLKALDGIDGVWKDMQEIIDLFNGLIQETKDDNNRQ